MDFQSLVLTLGLVISRQFWGELRSLASAVAATTGGRICAEDALILFEALPNVGHLANASSFQLQVPLILKHLTAYSEAHPSQQTTAAKGNIRRVRIAFAPLSTCHSCLSPCRSPVVPRRPRQHAQGAAQNG